MLLYMYANRCMHRSLPKHIVYLFDLFRIRWNRKNLWPNSKIIFYLKIIFFLLFTRIRIPYDICDNRSITHYQHWSIIILINILITPLETSYALWLAKTDLFTVMPILRYYQRNCVFIVGKKNNDSFQYGQKNTEENKSKKNMIDQWKMNWQILSKRGYFVSLWICQNPVQTKKQSLKWRIIK